MRMRDQLSWQAAAFLVASSVLVPTDIWAESTHYSVVTDERLEHLHVRACFDGSVPRRLTAHDERAPNLLHAARLEGLRGAVALQPQGATLTLPPTVAPACLEYRVDLSAIGHGHWRSGSWRTEDAIVLPPDLWLWYPDHAPDDERWRLEFELPPGYDVSAPWDRIDRTQQRVTYALRGRMADWVLVHELSHLLHPSIVNRDRWLSEGLASYYQNVLRARAGLLSDQWAWTELHAGFERGVRGTSPGRSLSEVSETMMRDHSFMRVYWSGAAIALLADVELRRRSGGSKSLDTALAAFRDCCPPSDGRWSARELMRRLDQLTGETVFMDLYRENIDSDDFPDLQAVYRELGLHPMGATDLRVDPTAPGAAICRAIMTAPEA